MRQGFTLIEVMVAAAVLAVGCLGVLGMLMTSINHNREARDSSAAVTIAEQALYDLEIQATEWNTNKTIGSLGQLYQASTKSAGQWHLLKTCDINGVQTGKPSQDRFAIGYYILKPDTTTASNEHIRGSLRVIWNNSKNNVDCLGVSMFAKMDKFSSSNKSCSSISIPFALGPNIVQ